MPQHDGGAVPGAWRLFLPALIGWAGAAAVIPHPGAGLWLVVIGASVGGAALVAGLLAVLPGARRGPHARARSGRAVAVGRALIAHVSVACAVLVLVGAAVCAGERVRRAPELAEAAATAREVELDVHLRGFASGLEPSSWSGQQRAWVPASVRAPTGQVPVVLWLESDAAVAALNEPDWAPGARMGVRARVVALDPGSSAAYGLRVESVPGAPRAGPAGRWAAELRHGLRHAAASAGDAELVPGFAVGDTDLVREETERALEAASTSHLLAVSGANCALIVTAVSSLAAYAGAGRRMRLVTSAGALLCFVWVVGPDASVQRAGIMAAVTLVSRFGGKRSVGLAALGGAVVLLLVTDPWRSLEPGFALSVAATAGIIILVPEIERVMLLIVPVPRWVTLPVAVALAAQISCGPLLLLVQDGIPAVGVLANVLSGIAAPLGTATGLLAMLTLPVAPWAGAIWLEISSWASRYVIAVAQVTTGLPGARWSWPQGWAGAAALAAVEGALLVAWLLLTRRIARRVDRRAGRRPWSARRGGLSTPVRTLAAVLVCAALGSALGPTIISPRVAAGAVPDGWWMVVCDVGQGDAILLRDPRAGPEAVLVDTGEHPDRLRRCLERYRVTEISLLVLTHDDRDHTGALAEVVGITEHALVAPPTGTDAEGVNAAGTDGHSDNSRERSAVRELQQAGVPYTVGYAGLRGAGSDLAHPEESGSARGTGAEPGEEGRGSQLARRPTEPTTQSVAGVRWRVLAPQASARPADTNSASLVLRASVGDASVLLLADTGADEQRSLRELGDVVQADAVKIAHHGSRDRDEGLAATVGAEYAIVSVGEGNGYGHPAADTIADFSDAGAVVLRTDVHGSVALSADAGGLRVSVERASREAASAVRGAAGSMSGADSRVEAWQQLVVRRIRSLNWSGPRRALHPSC